MHIRADTADLGFGSLRWLHVYIYINGSHVIGTTKVSGIIYTYVDIYIYMM